MEGWLKEIQDSEFFNNYLFTMYDMYCGTPCTCDRRLN